MKIEVTAEDIKGASTNMCSMCPVAQAMRRAVGLDPATPETASRFDAMAQPSRLFANGIKGMIACDTPPEVRAAILEWDAKGKMEPFTFEVPTTQRPPLYEWNLPGATHW